MTLDFYTVRKEHTEHLFVHTNEHNKHTVRMAISSSNIEILVFRHQVFSEHLIIKGTGLLSCKIIGTG